MDELVPHILRAERTVRSRWREVARTYTLSWGRLEECEDALPFVVDGVRNIRHLIMPQLPVLVYRRREGSEQVVVAVAYAAPDTRFDTRLLGNARVDQGSAGLLNDFAQCLWFLLDTGVLPSAADEPEELRRTLIKWTDRKLLE
jgi:hypothetical protein